VFDEIPYPDFGPIGGNNDTWSPETNTTDNSTTPVVMADNTTTSNDTTNGTVVPDVDPI